MSFTVTTSIAYPNASPHLGYALELVQADFLARAARLRGEDAYFLTGVDQHGLKIEQAAQKAGLGPLEFVTPLSDAFEQLSTLLTISYDRFIRTTDLDHIATAQAFWLACVARGDIYKRQYQAWYDIKEETFLGSKEEFPDPSVFETPAEFIQLIDEENYFFRQSRYQEQITSLIKNGSLKIIPESRGRELLNFVEQKGLPDVSISRAKASVKWGIPVPDDETQVLYVWFDALTNYLTATSHLKAGNIIPNSFWPATVHCVGKDIQRFHALLWPAMLLSAGFALPKTILVHGFLSVNGKKMSKSLGNVLDPVPLIEKYGSDSLRWLLLKEVATTADADITEARLATLYSADLANTLGNLVSRLVTMLQKYSTGVAPTWAPDPGNVAADWEEYSEALKKYDIKAALEIGFQRLEVANRMIEERKPWALAKDPGQSKALDELLYQLLEGLRHSMLMLQPALPMTAEKLSWLLATTSHAWGGVGDLTVLPTKNEILFPRLND